MPRYDWNHTDYHELPLDYIMKLCRESMGLKLKVVGNELALANDLDEIISKVTVSYATTALEDTNGRPLRAYLLSVGTSDNTLVFTDGQNGQTILTVPFATKAEKDVNGNAILGYMKNLSVVGDKLRVTLGDGTTTDITVPYAIKASTDENDKDISTYGCELVVDGKYIILKDSLSREISRITLNYANSLEAGTTTIKLIGVDNSILAEITVPYATAARNDDAGHEIKSSYGHSLKANSQTIELDDYAGTKLSEITVPFATVATNATNAIQNVTVVGDQIIFTTYGGQTFAITSPYSVKATKDDLNNTIKTTYVASVQNDVNTGKITFYDATGSVLTEIIPTINKATNDSYNNLIADYIKQIVASPNSNYISVTHGTGTTDSITVNYSNTAWKDTNGNVIKNTYVKRLACLEDVDDGHYKLVAYNGDTPEAELFRIDILAYSAQTDINGRALTSYVGEVSVNASDNIDVKDGEGNVVNTISGKVTTTPAGTVSQPSFTGSQMTSTGSFTPAGTISGTAVSVPSTTVQEITGVGTLPSKAADTFVAPSKAADTYVAPSATYDATTETLTFNPGSFAEGAFTPGSFTEGAFNAGTLPTKADKTVGAAGAATVTDGTFTGTAGTVNVSGTPSGTVSQPTFTGTQATNDVVFDD